MQFERDFGLRGVNPRSRARHLVIVSSAVYIGDGNGGHIWGTDLAEPDRMALLEYLKTY